MKRLAGDRYFSIWGTCSFGMSSPLNKQYKYEKKRGESQRLISPKRVNSRAVEILINHLKINNLGTFFK